jgi:SPP1 gp7 family putative phage head morphogenesis protein
MAAKQPPPPDRYAEAIAWFRNRVPMTDEEFAALDVAERQKAFTVAGVTQARPIQEIFNAIDRAIADGTTLDDFKDEVGAQLEDAWGGKEAPRTEAVFRTNVLGAYNGGRYAIMTDPVVLEARPMWRFDDVDDSRECEICAPLHGHVAPADSAFWTTHHPPLHHLCRCVLTPLTDEEAHAEGVPSSHPSSEPPDEGFGAPPAHADGEPDLSGFDPDIRRALEKRLE